MSHLYTYCKIANERHDVYICQWLEWGHEIWYLLSKTIRSQIISTAIVRTSYSWDS